MLVSLSAMPRKSLKTVVVLVRLDLGQEKTLYNLAIFPNLLPAVKDLGIYHTVLGKATFKEALPQSFGDCRLVFAYRDYYLTVPEDVLQQKSDNQGRVVALDPGIRTFITFFSECSFGEIGTSANLLQKLCFRLDKLISKSTKAKCKQRRRMKLAASRLRGKIKNLVDELHRKTARFLVDNFDMILMKRTHQKQSVGLVKSSPTLVVLSSLSLHLMGG